MRLYSAGEQVVVQKAVAAEKDATMPRVSFSMVLPMFALFAVGGAAVAVVVRRAARASTRHVPLAQSPADEDLLSASSDAEMLLE
jgi:hypothetical protein